jgi:FMN phosphatase YigB (HAD superfamily)
VKEKSIPIVIVTDLTAAIQFRKLDSWKISPFIHSCVASEESGKEKPNLDSFKLACEKAGYSDGRIWMIGDDIEKDMKGAKQIEAITFWKRNGKAHSDHDAIDASFDSFMDLTELLTKGKSKGINWNNY